MKRGDVVQYSMPVNAEAAKFRFVLLRQPEKRQPARAGGRLALRV